MATFAVLAFRACHTLLPVAVLTSLALGTSAISASTLPWQTVKALHRAGIVVEDGVDRAGRALVATGDTTMGRH